MCHCATLARIQACLGCRRRPQHEQAGLQRAREAAAWGARPEQALFRHPSLQAIQELHEDDDFQADASPARMMDVVEEIRSDGAAMARHQRDKAVMHVLGKLRRFQARLKP